MTNNFMQDTDKKYKNLVIIAIILALVLALFLKRCGNGVSDKPTIKIDTVYKEVKGDVTYIPDVDTIYYTKTKYVPTNPDLIIDTMYLPELIDVDTLAILKDYYAHVVYEDTLRNQYGYISVTDTISQNRIKSRQVKTALSIPEVTKTITLTQPKKAQIYLGANFLGNQDDPLLGYNVNISLKTKRDKFIEAGYNQFYGGTSFYSLGLKFKISFRKQ